MAARSGPTHLLERLHVGEVHLHLLQREGLDAVVAAKTDAAVLLQHRLLLGVRLDVVAGQVYLQVQERGQEE